MGIDNNIWNKILNSTENDKNNINLHKNIVLYPSTEAINDVIKEEPGSLPESVDEPKPTEGSENSGKPEENNADIPPGEENSDASGGSEMVETTNNTDTEDSLTDADKKINNNVFASSNGQLKLIGYYDDFMKNVKECINSLLKNGEYKGVVTELETLLSELEMTYNTIAVSNIYDISASYHLLALRFKEITKNIPVQTKEDFSFKFDTAK